MLLIFNCNFGHFGNSNEVPMYTEASKVGRRKKEEKEQREEKNDTEKK